MMFSLIKNKLKQNYFINNLYTKIKWRERKIHPGKENPEKTFYIIRRHNTGAGIFSFVLTGLGAIQNATDNGYVPVIDMQNYDNVLLLPDEVGKRNAWEDYFLQPSIGLETAFKSRNVILGNISDPDQYPDFPALYSSIEVSKWRKVASAYLHLRPEHEVVRDEYIEKYFCNKRVLGVLCRGTDYLMLCPHDHPIQPSKEEMIKKCKKCISDWKCDLIYLATEDEMVWKAFQREFPNRIISYQTEHYSSKEGELIGKTIRDDKNVSPSIWNVPYVISISILAKCDYLIAGATSGSAAALLMSDGYKESFIFNLGTYT